MKYFFIIFIISCYFFMGLRSSTMVNMEGPVAKFVKEQIPKEKVVIFSKSYCPYCKMAKEVFDKLSQKYYALELDQREDGEEIQDVLKEITGARSVPRVFINGNFVGGGSDVKALQEKGELVKLLQ
ncbi:unnamed protein product [Bemisia tabaci]|uniref:Glutaredoxin-2, mitochondrial n=1 Tax=Bemisia tabaci TaxID=7038 RepID=A0A9P0AG57_BEMTA|nr:PREDICTED: glutaredoxin-C4-like isoform X1 [Bemisia tabaci]CAH0393855.1 unnamed protein product [Bemisia tabaci]